MTDTRNVLLKCRHSVLSMIRYDAAAGHVVLVECHHSVFSMIRGVLLCVVELGGFFRQNNHFLNLHVPGIDIAMGWLIQHPTDQYKRQSAGNALLYVCAFFCPIHAYFLRITVSISLSFVTHIRGQMARTPLPSSLPCVPSF